MRLQSFGLTDIGRKRQSNQDSYIYDERAKLFMVADGMGGHAAGEVASRIAADTVSRIFTGALYSFDPSSQLIKAIQEANQVIHQESGKNISLKGMGTTATCLYFSLDTVYVAHVGDSRAYFIRDGMIWQLSQDHSLISEQSQVGDPQVGISRTLKNVITRSVGFDREVEVDLYTKKISIGDIYVLCSDGLYGLVKNGEIAKMISTASLKEASKKLVDLANARGGEDNITVVAVKVEEL